MSLIYGLLKKHGCADVGELIALRDRLSEELYDSTRLEEEAEELRSRIKALESELDDVASKLHESRVKASDAFAGSITESLRFMELPYAVFEVEINDAPISATGRDGIIFRFSATGKNAADVAKCASGGEMSRIML